MAPVFIKAPNLDRSLKSDPYVWSEPSITIWAGPQTSAKQGVSFSLFQETLKQMYLPCHYLVMDQADSHLTLG